MSKADIAALKLLAATEDFVEALQAVSCAAGPWPQSNDNYDHACNCVASMQKIAFDVLTKHGFTPRGTLVE